MIPSVYNHYMSTYYNFKPSNRYDTHKKSELRSIYNNIVKLNKESPLYKVNLTDELQSYAISIKEEARNMKNVISSLSDEDMGFHKKIPYSSAEDILSVDYTDFDNENVDTDFNCDLQIDQLALPQINTGTYVGGNQLSVTPGSYTLGMNVSGIDYEFQLGVDYEDTNQGVLTRLANIINRSHIGLSADILHNAQGKIALELKSVATGGELPDNIKFKITDIQSPNNMQGLSSAYHLDHITQLADNARFSLIGTERSSSSNTFTINKTFEITLHKTTQEDESVHLGFKTDVDSIQDNVQTLIGSYNSMLRLTHEYLESQKESSTLAKDISSAAKLYRNELEALGFTITKGGDIETDSSLLTQALDDEELPETISTLNQFKSDLMKRVDYAFIDPMKYVDKVLVTYPNPASQHFASPYITSIYSGMLFNGYC